MLNIECPYCGGDVGHNICPHQDSDTGLALDMLKHVQQPYFNHILAAHYVYNGLTGIRVTGDGVIADFGDGHRYVADEAETRIYQARRVDPFS